MACVDVDLGGITFEIASGPVPHTWTEESPFVLHEPHSEGVIFEKESTPHLTAEERGGMFTDGTVLTGVLGTKGPRVVVEYSSPSSLGAYAEE
jgi:hypothetical protein